MKKTIQNIWEDVKYGAKKSLVTLLVPIMMGVAGCGKSNLKYVIEPVAQADFDKDGIDELIGYTADPAFNDSRIFALVLVNGKYIKKAFEHNDTIFYAEKDKIRTIQPFARFGDDTYNISNVSVNDINGDGWPDIGYDMNERSGKYRTYINQKNGKLMDGVNRRIIK